MKNKEDIRAEIKLMRKSLTKSEIEEMSRRITENVASLSQFQKAECVCIFISAFNEPRTDKIADLCAALGKKVCAPVTDEKTGTMSLCYVNGSFRRGAYGIWEPDSGEKTDFDVPDFILVPGLAFDREKNRIGFGGGYYDKFLSVSRGFKAGICYSFQLFDKIPHEKHDIKTDIVITEREKV